MGEYTVLGIDCGGTHTDAAILAIQGQRARLLASAKTSTLHDDLPKSVRTVLEILAVSSAEQLKNVRRVTLGTTLEINALVQNRADTVGLALSAGPGLDPLHFAIGNNVCVVPGGLDHRGVEIEKLFTRELAITAGQWARDGVDAIACVGKFSPRNPAHENEMGAVAAKASSLPVTLGHTLSGRLNFPRRIATAYYNAAVGRLHENFLNSMEKALATFGISAQCRLLKADGGAMPFAASRQEPVQSILSGPAASVMGVLAMWPDAAKDCALLLDTGGTTTDIALFYEGSPVVDRQGMILENRRTLVKSMASISIAVGGDSLIDPGADGKNARILPLMTGPAMAFGGTKPTFLDALNYLDAAPDTRDRGDVDASRSGLENMAASLGGDKSMAADIAQNAVANAMDKIVRAATELVENINSGPIYTIAALKAAREARPQKIYLVGGPAHCLRQRMEASFGMPVEIASHFDVANAIGAALTIPTAWLEVYADTGKRELSAPALNYRERIDPGFTLKDAEQKAMDLLTRKLEDDGGKDANVQIVESDLFATLDDHGRGAKDMRVACQARPGIIAMLDQ